LPHVNKTELDSEIKKIKSAIRTEGFENIAIKSSISESAIEGGDVGWVSETSLPENLKNIIEVTQIGKVSEAIILPEGILIFKLRDKRKVENVVDLEEVKNEIIRKEKSKILNMHSLSHYDRLRRGITIKYY